MPALSPDLRKALLSLPAKEKDQLLTRLVSQDALLVEQLGYRLLEGPAALETRRQRLCTQIDDPVRGYHPTPNDLLLIVRQLQARIAYHAKVTGDAFGEVELTVRLLNRVFEHQPATVVRLHGPTQPLLQHLVRRTHEALNQARKLHKDYHVELAEGLNQLLANLWQSAASPLARELGLPARW